MQRTARKIFKRFAAFMLFFALLFGMCAGGVSARVYADTGGELNYDNTNVLDDLKSATVNGDPFDLSVYPRNPFGTPQVGDHATNMSISVYFGKSGDKFPIAESIKYKYDKMGNICRIDENGAPVVWYKYDALNRLVHEDNKTFGEIWLFSYDNKGNILCKREVAFILKENAEECEFTSVQYECDGASY